jgi:hypothetical protein
MSFHRSDEGWPAGPLVLVATTLPSTTYVFDLMTRAEEIDLCCEFVPERGPADPSWRYICFGPPLSTCMVQRGSRVSERLSKAFTDIQGVLEVPRGMYQELVAACARASSNPARNRAEISAFAARHEQFLWSGKHAPTLLR